MPPTVPQATKSMITVVHGGQTGVDRGAHEAAIDNSWSIAGYMPRDQRDERGKIPEAVARYLRAHEKASYSARTEANVRSATAALFVVPDANNPRTTPGTTKTLELATERRLRYLIVAPSHDPTTIARWIWSDFMMRILPLPFEGHSFESTPLRLLIAGPRESKWQGAHVQTAILLRGVAQALVEIS